MELNKYTELFQQEKSKYGQEQQAQWDTIYKIGLSIVNDSVDNTVNQLNQIILEQQEQIKMLEKKLPKPKEKKKTVKYEKRIEKKVVNLIIRYRKTTKEIKDIIKEENKIELSDRSINEIRNNNNIKGYKIIEKTEEN